VGIDFSRLFGIILRDMRNVWLQRISLWLFSALVLSLGWGASIAALAWWESPRVAETPSEVTTAPFQAQEKVSIPTVGIEIPILYPTSVASGDLASALNRGVTHYPDSPLPSDATGNSFFFGHSSARVEKNPARSAFTNLRNVTPGDQIEMWHKGRVYLYRVARVKILKPHEAEVYFASEKKTLTLSTCWPVGDPTNRFIVEAEFVRSIPQRSFVADLSP
jgi:LPXTG-site transpeptidase (sortase) family protein